MTEYNGTHALQAIFDCSYTVAYIKFLIGNSKKMDAASAAIMYCNAAFAADARSPIFRVSTGYVFYVFTWLLGKRGEFNYLFE